MAESSWPYDAGAGANILESQWREMAGLWLPDGPILAEDLEAECFGDSSGMQVKVRTGKAWIRGAYWESDAQETLAIAANGSGNPRIDRCVLRNDFAANQTVLAILQGTPGAAPSPPGLTQSSSIWEVSLAQIAVANGAATITAANVTDERLLVPKGGGPYVRRARSDVLTASDITVNDDTELFLWAAANEVWRITALIRATGPGGLRWTFTAPAGSSGGHGHSASSSGAALASELTQAVTDGELQLVATVVNGATAGWVRFRWAQSSSNVTATTRRANSLLLPQRLA